MRPLPISAGMEALGHKPAATLRRAGWLAAVAALTLLSACATAPAPAPTPAPTRTAALDPKNGDGLGGTGIKTANNNRGDGLGGTGIVGTITGFGSIIVNGLELEFDRQTNVA